LFTAIQFVCPAVFARPNSSSVSETPSYTSTKSSTQLTGEEIHLIPGTIVYGYGFGIDEANRLAKDGVFIGKDSKDNYMDLAHGNVVLLPDKNMIVSTHAADIHISARATVFVMESSNGLIIYDLGSPQSQHFKEVVVVVNKYKLIMQPGRMLALTGESQKDLEALREDCRFITYRNPQYLDLRNTALKAFVADFSIPTAMLAIEPLKRLAVSNNSQDKLMLKRLLY